MIKSSPHKLGQDQCHVVFQGANRWQNWPKYELSRPRLSILFKGGRYCIQKRNNHHHFHSWFVIIVFKDKLCIFFVVLNRSDKLDPIFLKWQLLSLVCPLRNQVILILSRQSLSMHLQRWQGLWIRSISLSIRHLLVGKRKTRHDT